MYNSTSMGEIFLSRLPMGIAGLSDMFQEKMSGLMGDLKFVRTYLYDLLIMTKPYFAEHIQKLDKVLNRLKQAGLQINGDKEPFHQIAYNIWLIYQQGKILNHYLKKYRQ